MTKRASDVFDAEPTPTPSTSKRVKTSNTNANAPSAFQYCMNAGELHDRLTSRDTSPGASSRRVPRGTLLIARVTNYASLGDYCLFTCSSASTLTGGPVLDFEVVLSGRVGRKAAKALAGHVDASALPNTLMIGLDGGVAGGESAKAAFRVTYSQGVRFQFGARKPVEVVFSDVPTLPSFSFDHVSAPVIVKSEPALSPSPSPPQISNEKEQEKENENTHTSLSLDKITPAAPRVFRSSNKCSTIADALPRAINAAGRKVYADIIVEVVALPMPTGNTVDILTTDYSTTENFYPDAYMEAEIRSTPRRSSFAEDLAKKYHVVRLGFFDEFAAVANAMSVGEVYHLRNVAFLVDDFHGRVKGRVCYYANERDGMKDVARVIPGTRDHDPQYMNFQRRKLQYSQPSGHTFNTPPLISTSSRPQASESEAATVTKALSRHRKSLLD